MGGVRHWLTTGLLAATLASATGCLSCCHPVAAPPPELLESCHTVPGGCRNHVYVFIMDGIDPVCFCNLAGVHDYLLKLGFIKTYQGELYHCFWYNHEIRSIHKEDPDARFVLIGHGLGANLAQSMARDLEKEDIYINLLVYLGGNSMASNLADKPGNVGRMVNVIAPGAFWDIGGIDSAENVHLDSASHWSAPTDQQTLTLLMNELMQVAMTVPYQEHAPKPLRDPEMAPTPRPIMPNLSATRDEWDFLKPSDRLTASSAVQYPAAEPAPADEPPPHTTLKPKNP
jgi:hypothetical protein